MTIVHLSRAMFSETPRVLVEADSMRAELFRYATGVEAVRLCNPRGEVVVLPYMGQIVWSARFDGADLAMASQFDMPRPAASIVDTYGCLAFHSGLLRNGVPGPEDTHALHGEFAVAVLDSAWLALGEGIGIGGSYRHVKGFGDHYLATPAVTLGRDATMFEVAMTVRNCGGRPMDLMYMCHVNFAFVPDGVIEQAAPFDAETLRVRTAVPPFVRSSPEYEARLAAMAGDPSASRVLSEDLVLDPELVFYVQGLGVGADGRIRVVLRRPEGDGFAIAYDPRDFPHTVRWLLRDPDAQVAGIALPSTCHPEGFMAERRKGQVQSVAPGETRRFAVELGYVGQTASQQEAR